MRLCALVLVVGCARHAGPPAESPATPTPVPEMNVSTDLDALTALGVFELRAVAGPVASPITQQGCAWFGVSSGVANVTGGTPAFSMRRDGPTSDEDAAFDTPLGRLDLSWRKLRPHLQPSFVASYRTATELPAAPDWMRPRFADDVAEAAGTDMRPEGSAPGLTVAEYALIAGRSHWARVGVESYMLPPEPGSDEPREGRNLVLIIADAPFAESPTSPLVPAFAGWSY
jgi:hypothetical protein